MLCKIHGKPMECASCRAARAGSVRSKAKTAHLRRLAEARRKYPQCRLWKHHRFYKGKSRCGQAIAAPG